MTKYPINKDLSSRQGNENKRKLLYEELTENSEHNLRDILEPAELEDAEIIFNSKKSQIVSTLNHSSKIFNSEYLFKVNKEYNYSKNYILFFLTRRKYKELIDLKRTGDYIPYVSKAKFLDIPIPKLKSSKFLNIRSTSLDAILNELLFAEQNKQYFSICILSGTILEFILLGLLEELQLPEIIMKKFNQLEGLKTLVKHYKLIDEESSKIFEPIFTQIQNTRNLIHAHKNYNEKIEKIESYAEDSINNIEKLILYFGL